jgi:metal-responsive CopG/Arc/MetJ family transcriptional regulator
MATAKIAITLDVDTVKKLDRMVGKKIFPNRSKAIQEAVEEKLSRMDKNRLARECAKLNPRFEQALAEEGIHMEPSEWSEY